MLPGMQMMDIPGRRWSLEMLELLGVREEQLGRMFESPEVTGWVNREAAALTGLCEGTPVVGGAGRQCRGSDRHRCGRAGQGLYDDRHLGRWCTPFQTKCISIRRDGCIPSARRFRANGR